MERKRKAVSFVQWAAVFLMIALVLPASLQAQETRGRITGRVTDATKAALPGATVTVTDLARGTTAVGTTNEQGLFQVSYLLPGTYKIQVEFPGFKTHVQDKVPLQLAETLNFTFVLEIGAVSETVSVVGESPMVNTSDASMGLVVDQERLSSLPLIHGDPYKIMGLATGLAHSGAQRLDRPYEPTHIIGYAYDGTRSNRSDLLIDGAPSTATANANEVIASYVPPSDMVQEFKVQTATFDAQFGNTEGGVTSIVIKSGTNRYHGSAYYFAEPYKLGAKDYFGELRGDPMIKSSSNRPGFSIGGPIFKDKTFFMFGFERIKDVRPRFDASGDSWVPTEKLRRGDFSDYSANITIYNPYTRVPTGTGQYVGQPFANNMIPDDMISPISKAILEYYCLPKNPGLVGNITDSTLPETANYNNLTGRVDQQFSNSNRMFGRFSWYKRDSIYNDYLNSIASGTNFQFISYQAVVDDVHIFNPTTTLNVRYGYNRFERNSGLKMEARNFDLTTLGFPSAYNDLIPEINRYFPRLDFDGNTMIDIAQGADYRPVITHSFAAVMNKSLSAHALKAGMDFRRYGENSRSTANAQSGRYQFTNAYTRPSSVSSSDYAGLQNYAAFLLGLPSTTSISRVATYHEYSDTWGFFVQDDWRVGSKLTMNLGLRYEFETPLVERDNQSITGFDTEYVQPIQSTVQANYAALNDPALKALVPQLYVKGGLKFAGVDGPRGVYNTPKNILLPRLGFAYQFNSKTVVRGGAGLFAGFLGERRGDVITYGYSQDTTIGTTFNAHGAPIPQSWDQDLFSGNIVEPVGNANGPQTYLGQGITFFNQDPKVSKQLRWQIGVQHEFARDLVVEAAYVGNYGYNIEITRNINALPAQYLNTDNSRTAAMNANNTFLGASVKNPFAGLLPGSSYNNPTIARSQLMRPYPEFGDINTTNNDGKSWYNSAQVSLRKRFSQGYTLGVSYTYSHWEQATEYLSATDPLPTRMISDLDVTNRLSISGIYELPFGRGKHFLTDASGVLEGFVGGWQVQGVYTYQTGFPVQFNSDIFYNGSDAANGSDIAISSPTIQEWFNTDVFTSILNSTSTNATPVNHLRALPFRFDTVRADSINNVDMSILKDVALGGDFRIQVRLEFINLLNEPYVATGNGQIVVGPTSTTFGQVTASNQQNYARRAQVGVKLLF
jgi:Carboxypeptidase regulatory-like domain